MSLAGNREQSVRAKDHGRDGECWVVIRDDQSAIGFGVAQAQPGVDRSEASPVGQSVTGFRLRDYLGAEHSLEDVRDQQLVVIAFIGTECPLAKIYGSKLASMATKYSDQGVAFIAINSNQQDTPTELGHFARKHQIKFPLLKDPGNRVADQLGAIRTPEVFLLDQDRIVRYWGRIDDQLALVMHVPMRRATI